jgi:hypothetical protein
MIGMVAEGSSVRLVEMSSDVDEMSQLRSNSPQGPASVGSQLLLDRLEGIGTRKWDEYSFIASLFSSSLTHLQNASSS